MKVSEVGYRFTDKTRSEPTKENTNLNILIDAKFREYSSTEGLHRRIFSFLSHYIKEKLING